VQFAKSTAVIEIQIENPSEKSRWIFFGPSGIAVGLALRQLQRVLVWWLFTLKSVECVLVSLLIAHAFDNIQGFERFHVISNRLLIHR